MKDPIYSDIEVQLTGEDGNAFLILGKVRKAMKRAGVPASVQEDFTNEATSGDYGHLLRTCARWVTVQ